ncbi:MAG: ATP-binding cassette domain-containing protein [Actinomycetota bacterium]
MVSNHTVELRGVSFTDDDGNRILDGASRILHGGSTTCVVGATDRDQSALTALLLGLHHPQAGTVEIDGRSLRHQSLLDRRALVAGVLQDPWLIEGSIADNVAFQRPHIDSDAVEAACRAIGSDRFIDRFPNRYHQPITKLSQGQRRSLALARAVAGNPGVLVLEDPTADLDPDDEREMMRAIEAASQGRTTIILTRRLSLARRADAVLVVDDGQLVPYRNGGPNSHSELWDTRVPPVVEPETGRRLRLVGRDERRPAQPTRGSWDITIGSEFVPDHLASGLLSRNTNTETWVAWSIKREEPVRIKVPRISSEWAASNPDDPVSYHAWEQLAREHRVLRALDHPGVARPLDADLEAEMPFLTLEYLDSTSLARVLQREPDGLAPLDAVHIGFELASTLQHLHQRGHVHLNLRAGHVRTRGELVVITDFTQCRPIGAKLPELSRPARSQRIDRRLFAPEFRPGQAADPMMDIYALGSLIRRATIGSVMSAGRASGDGAGQAAVDRSAVPMTELRDDVPAAMVPLVEQMLSADPGERPDAGEVVSQFRRILPPTMVRPRAAAVRTRSTRLRLVSPNP